MARPARSPSLVIQESYWSWLLECLCPFVSPSLKVWGGGWRNLQSQYNQSPPGCSSTQYLSPSLTPHVLIGKVTTVCSLSRNNPVQWCPEWSNRKDKRTNYYLMLSSCPGTSHTCPACPHNVSCLVSREPSRVPCPLTHIRLMSLHVTKSVSTRSAW